MPEKRTDAPSPEPTDEQDARGPATDPASELEEGLDHLGRAVGGVLTRLLGPRYTKVDLDPDRPVLSPEADRAVDEAGETLGRWLRATGEGLRSHPTDPVKALDHASRHKDEAVEVREGEAPFAAGVRALAGGLYKSTEAVLDVVAPRRPKGPVEGGGQGPVEGGGQGEGQGEEDTTGEEE